MPKKKVFALAPVTKRRAQEFVSGLGILESQKSVLCICSPVELLQERVPRVPLPKEALLHAVERVYNRIQGNVHSVRAKTTVSAERRLRGGQLALIRSICHLKERSMSEEHINRFEGRVIVGRASILLMLLSRSELKARQSGFFPNTTSSFPSHQRFYETVPVEIPALFHKAISFGEARKRRQWSNQSATRKYSR